MIESYPLFWPQSRPRTPAHQVARSRFDSTQDRAQRALLDEIRRLGGRETILSTNIRLRNDGLPYASQREPDDAGVAVYFTYKKQPMCFACDRYWRMWENMHAIRLTIEALRGIARWGTGDMMESAFRGFTALPAPGAQRSWREVLGVAADETDINVVRANYRSRAAQEHPDRGGDHNAMSEINQAWAQAQEALK